MGKDQFQYLLRYGQDPSFYSDEKIARLEEFVQDADIDDVAVFINNEQLNTGHQTLQEQAYYLEMLKDIRRMLKKHGITMSVNQWNTLMHNDMGQPFRKEHHFRGMVDVSGYQSQEVVCPLCQEWQQFAAKIFANYVQFEPNIIWVEDDLRLDNHMPLEWGGCFCEEHMKIYSERAGKELTREEFIKGILQPGEPSPYRKIWLDVARESIESAAKAIADGVYEECRKRGIDKKDRPRIGLMTSDTRVGAAQGRDWKRLLGILADGGQKVDRVCLPSYSESMSTEQYLKDFNQISTFTKAMVGPDTEIYPELENYPYSLFSKSVSFTRFQLISAMALGIRGITLNLYDILGNGINKVDGYDKMLHEVKPYLNKIVEGGLLRGHQKGVKVLYSERSSYTMHLTKGEDMTELYPGDGFFGVLLTSFGIPCEFTDRTDMKGQVVAIGAQVLRCFDKETIEKLLKNNFCIFNGDAIDTLYDMELGHLLGVERIEWKPNSRGIYSYEQVTNGKVYNGIKEARAAADLIFCDALDITYTPLEKLTEYTAMYDPFRRRRFYGQMVVNDQYYVMPFGRIERFNEVPLMFLCWMRQSVMHDILSQAAPDLPMVKEKAYVVPYCYTNTVGGVPEYDIYLVNSSSDGLDRIDLLMGAKMADQIQKVLVLDSADAGPSPDYREVSFAKTSDGICIDDPLPPRECSLIRLIGVDEED